jgi:uncharacterized protein
MYHILSLSGGGFRGYFTASVLEQLEILHSGSTLYQATDLYAGTSIGGIISLGLAAGLSPQQLKQSFIDCRHQIFGHPRNQYLHAKYQQTGLRKAIMQILGKQVAGCRIASLPKPVMVTAVNLDTAKSVLISSIDPEYRHWRVLDAALATSAAPTYFPSHKVGGVRYIDGGMSANMPDMAALHHVLRYESKRLDDVRMLSVGTCYSGPELVPYARLNDDSGAMRWAKKLVPFFMDAQRNLIVEQCEQAFFQNHYARLDVPLPDNIELDDISDKAVKLIEHAVHRCIDEQARRPSVVAYMR